MKKILFILISFSLLYCSKDENPVTITQEPSNWKVVWQDLRVNIQSIDYLSNDSIYVCIYNDSALNQSILFSPDGGDTWSTKIINTNIKENIFVSVYPLTEDILISKNKKTAYFDIDSSMAYDQYYLKQSIDGGNSWIDFDKSGAFYKPENGNILIFDLNGILLSTDKAKSWTRVFQPYLYRNMNIIMEFVNKDVGYWLYDYYGVAKTIDGGKTWDSTKLDDPIHYEKVNFLCDTLWYAFNNSTLYKSTNYGKTWDSLFAFTGLMNTFYLTHGIVNSNLHFVTSSKGYFMSYNRIYKTEDGGKTWITDLDLPKPKYSIFKNWIFTSDGSIYAFTSTGTIYKKEN